MILSELEKKFLPSFKDFKLGFLCKFTRMPLKVLLHEDVKVVIKAMFKVIDLGLVQRGSGIMTRIQDHIPNPNSLSVPLCPNVSPRVVMLAAQLHG
jgi:hypothetical protein